MKFLGEADRLTRDRDGESVGLGDRIEVSPFARRFHDEAEAEITRIYKNGNVRARTPMGDKLLLAPKKFTLLSRAS